MKIKMSARPFIFVSFTLCSFLSSCLKDTSVSPWPSCTDEIVERNGMIRYTGQRIDCEFFLSMFLYEGAQYFSLGCHCADMLTSIVDCEGEVLCSVNEDCTWFYTQAKCVGIVGIRK